MRGDRRRIASSRWCWWGWKIAQNPMFFRIKRVLASMWGTWFARRVRRHDFGLLHCKVDSQTRQWHDWLRRAIRFGDGGLQFALEWLPSCCWLPLLLTQRYGDLQRSDGRSQSNCFVKVAGEDGKSHKTLFFRIKRVLASMWGTWCGESILVLFGFLHSS